MSPMKLIPFTTARNYNSSPMEKLLEIELDSKKVRYYREVMFKFCINPKTGFQLRYDFYIPDKNILIEYDGKEYHLTDKIRERDSVKDKFAKSNKIKLIRLSSRIAIEIFINEYFKEVFK